MTFSCNLKSKILVQYPFYKEIDIGSWTPTNSLPDYIIEHVALFKVRNFIQCYAALCDMFYNNNTSGMKWR